MKPVKTITNRDPVFLKTVYKFDLLVNLQNDDRFINNGEKFIQYTNTNWEVYRMNKERIPRLCGRFNSLHRAVFRARLSV